MSPHTKTLTLQREETSSSEHLLLSTTLRCLEEGIITVDTQEKIILLNRMAKKLTGWSQEEAFGKTLSEVFILLHSKTHKPHKNIVEKIFLADKSANLPKHSLLIARDSAQRHIGGHVAPVHDNDGRIMGMVLAFRDITESVQAEEILERQAHDLRKRVKELNCLYTISSLVEKHGSAFKHLFKEIVSLIPEALERPDSICARLTIDNKTYTTNTFQETAWKHESLISINDKAIGNLEVFLLNFDLLTDTDPFSEEEQNLIKAVAERLADIVEMKRAEEEKEALEHKLQQAQRIEALGRLSGGIAHDFNNILSPIICYTELCLSEMMPEDAMRAYLDQVLHAAHRAKDLTHQLLACGRKQVLEVKGVDLEELVENFNKMIRRTLRENIEIEILLEPNLPLAKADPAQLEQILLNLTLNAQDAMPQGGKLSLAIAAALVDEAFCQTHEDLTPGSYLKLTVSDTGQGMPAKVLNNIFEPFFTTKALGKGTGLGLATVHGIVRQHGGCITVQSKINQGSVFTLYLPCADPAPEILEKTPAASHLPSGQETILVVEDEEQVRAAVTHILSAQGYTVLAAANAEEALQVASQNPNAIPLLITDVILPKVNGKDLHQQLLSQFPSLKVLFISGYTSSVIGQHGILEPGTHFLPKPFTMKELTNKVRNLLDQ